MKLNTFAIILHDGTKINHEEESKVKKKSTEKYIIRTRCHFNFNCQQFNKANSMPKYLASAIFLLLSVSASATSSSSSLRGNTDEASPCNTAKQERTCHDTTDQGEACLWCKCQAVPSECLSPEQAKLVPPGVFQCSTPSRNKSLKDRMTITADPVKDDLCDTNSKSGYMSVEGSEYDKDGEDKHLFYWQFDKRGSDPTDETIPFVVWLTGGPGCSSSLALLAENGPCGVNADGKSTHLNPFSWTQVAHVLWLDQPAGVGYSYGSEEDSNEAMISEDAYYFLLKFMEQNPQYANNPLFLVGESYGGHYVPAITHRIWRGNNNGDGAHLNLAGLAIGNGLTKPEEQYQWYAEMAFNNSHGIKVISKEEYEAMQDIIPKCAALIKECNAGDGALNTFACQTAFVVCNSGLVSPYQMTGLNPYNIEKQCGEHPLCSDFDPQTKFMNLPSTREALHTTNKSHKWEACNMGINLKFHTDWMKDFSHYVADLLDAGIPALIYAGDLDFICNYLGNKAWTYKLEWSGSEEFKAAEEHEWKTGGMARSAKGLTFMQVYDAGHMAPTDQPEVTLDMIHTFLTGGQF